MRLRDIKDNGLYKIKELDFSVPGSTLKSPGYWEMIQEVIRRRKEEIELDSKCYPDRYNRQVFRYDDNPPAYTITPQFAGMRRLIQELGLPEEQDTLYFLRLFSGPQFNKYALRPPSTNYQEYSVETLGLKIKLPSSVPSQYFLPLPDPSQYKCAPMYLEECGAYLIQIWRTRVFPCQVESIKTSPSNPLNPYNLNVIYFEERWHPQRGIERDLRGLENMQGVQASVKINKLYKDALEILTGSRKKRSKSFGPTRFTPDSFEKKYTDEAIRLFKIHKCIPKKAAVAHELNIPRSSFYNYLDYFELPWPPLELLRELQKVNF